MPIKILVGVPMYRPADLMPECQKSLELLKSDDKVVFEVLHGFGGSSPFMRNLVSAKGNKKIRQIPEYDFFLSIDSDMFFCLENALKLLPLFETYPSAGVVSAAYTNNGPNSHRLVAGFFKDGIPGNNAPELCINAYENKKIKVDWVGAGFAMIKKSVFEKLDYPWFRIYTIIVGDTSDLCTEDIALCMDAKKAGFEIYVDGSNRVGHCNR
jgi:hypothetical protein